MLARYGTSPDGKPVKKADIYTLEEHGIDPAGIDRDARRIIGRLKRAGHKAFVVGGAVRDLLTGRTPKDFDIATDAVPRRIRKLFRHSRIIGRRFRIVHVYVPRGSEHKIFEVATFRSGLAEGGNNVYGAMEEDVWRRDFSLNALFYCPEEQIIVDYVGGLRDIRERRLRTLAPTEASFLEDPVRMIRGVKYSVFTGFALPPAITGAIRKHRHQLASCSMARLTEEVYKILACGQSAEIFSQAYQLGLLEVFLPSLEHALRALGRRQSEAALRENLGALDERIRSGRAPQPSRGAMVAYLMKPLLKGWKRPDPGEDVEESLQRYLRDRLLPLVPSRRELGQAARRLLRDR
ncbi:MAG: polynucleotide adenylyltransferase PcnB [Spirochaetales bacterium]|nr:polynucleotide adenylyltransferase PcnB [Spirochaetales bacterium]